MTKSEYLKNPGRMASLPFWKEQKYGNLSTIKIVHEEQYKESDYRNYTKKHYFKLIHRLNEVPRLILDSSLEIDVVKIDQLEFVANFINQCYENIRVSKDEVSKWMNESVFSPTTWVTISKIGVGVIALGIADFDEEVKEGIFEWIQVLPEYQGKGIGKILVIELLQRLKYSYCETGEIIYCCHSKEFHVKYALREKN
ncbi:GNAT family N-acetyltransferase [Lachnoclostridium phytofermentans]|uniref:N-acetyltransferase domain-containing protein n=1 Tax=Lachnoclostridium phytofermentans (strain ATCC 700394 / DSM 18823 / ISDg) TaxID=357809 RepID=A9KM68_LACP7|nr:GNAT family N-acetyltransferase [Lachnoclostridium phytofermentans]ABX41411.1 hypothetical protein Cphy_1031 [Lachnoclostridium phytofermentans ISDg]